MKKGEQAKEGQRKDWDGNPMERGRASNFYCKQVPRISVDQIRLRNTLTPKQNINRMLYQEEENHGSVCVCVCGVWVVVWPFASLA